METLGRGFAWLDTGNHDSLLDAADFRGSIPEDDKGSISPVLKRLPIRRGFIDKEQLLKLAEPLMKTNYGQYLRVAEGRGSAPEGLLPRRSADEKDGKKWEQSETPVRLKD